NDISTRFQVENFVVALELRHDHGLRQQHPLADACCSGGLLKEERCLTEIGRCQRAPVGWSMLSKRFRAGYDQSLLVEKIRILLSREQPLRQNDFSVPIKG